MEAVPPFERLLLLFVCLFLFFFSFVSPPGFSCCSFVALTHFGELVIIRLINLSFDN